MKKRNLLIIGILMLVFLTISVNVSAAYSVKEESKIYEIEKEYPPEPYLPRYNPDYEFRYLGSLLDGIDSE